MQFFDFPHEILQKLEIALEKSEKTEHLWDENSGICSFYQQWHKEFSEIIKTNYCDTSVTTIIEYFNDFADLHDYIDLYEEEVVKYQERERFHIIETDLLKIKYGKIVKFLIFHISKLPLRSTNLFRKIFRKNLKPINYWKHKIYPRRIARYVFLNNFLGEMYPVFSKVLNLRQEIFLLLLETDNEIKNSYFGSSQQNKIATKNIQEISQKILDKDSEIRTKFDNLKTIFTNRYDEIYSKAGTFEYPSLRLKESRIRKQYLKQLKKFETTSKKWTNTAFSHYEYWRLQHEGRDVTIQLYNRFHSAVSDFNQKFETSIIPQYNEIIQFISEVKTKLSDNTETAKISTILQGVNDDLDKILLKQKIPNFIENIIELELTSIYDKISNTLSDSMLSLPLSKKLLKKANYSKAIVSEQIKEIAVRKLILEQVLSQINKTILSEKNTCLQNIEIITSATAEVSQIMEFALIYFASKTDITNIEVELNEIQGGIGRSFNKANEHGSYIGQFQAETTANLKKNIISFREEIESSILIENIFVVERKNARKIKIEQNQKRLETLIQAVKNLSIKSVELGKKALSFTKTQYKGITTLLGIDKQKVSLSSEIANYLSETEAAINNLPLIYQKLFKISPLADEVFYIPRTKILQKLSTAYKGWSREKFAVTCLIGEKGCGSTTTINFFLKTFERQYPVYRCNIVYNISDSQSLIGFFKEVFVHESFDNADEMIEALKQTKGKRIMVVENIQNLFVRKVGGFANLNILFRIMSETNSKVFWLTSCLQYSWNYLNRSINIGEYYSNIVKHDTLSGKQIVEIIHKRHKPSGFNLVYLPSPLLIFCGKLSGTLCYVRHFSLYAQHNKLFYKFYYIQISLFYGSLRKLCGL